MQAPLRCEKEPEDLPLPVNNLQIVYPLVWRWITEQLTGRLPAGMKALMIRRYALTSKTLNTTMRGMVAHDPLVKDVMTLLRKTMGGVLPRRIADWYNKELKLPQECVCLVQFLLRFRRSRRPSPHSIMPDLFASYAFPGRLKIVSKLMMQLVSGQWKKMWEQYCDHKKMATVLTSERPGGDTYWTRLS